MIKVIVADDHKIVREGISALVNKLQGVTVVAEAENGRECINLVRDLQPDVVIMDVAMSELNGIEATRQIMREMDAVKVVALSMHADRRFVQEMLAAGALGYVLKEAAFEELATAIKTVAANKTFLNPKVAGVVVKEYLQSVDSSSQTVPELTPREREVLQLIAEGKTNEQIADRLSVSKRTVEVHRSKIMHKLRIYNVAELTKYAIKEGITSV